MAISEYMLQVTELMLTVHNNHIKYWYKQS